MIYSKLRFNKKLYVYLFFILFSTTSCKFIAEREVPNAPQVRTLEDGAAVRQCLDIYLKCQAQCPGVSQACYDSCTKILNICYSTLEKPLPTGGRLKELECELLKRNIEK